jgi:hypothetical protein
LVWLQRRCELIVVVLASSRGLSRRRRAQPAPRSASCAVALSLRHFGVSNCFFGAKWSERSWVFRPAWSDFDQPRFLHEDWAEIKKKRALLQT